MKKIFTTAMLALLGAGAYAQTIPQTTQGSLVVSGSVYFNNEVSENTDNTSESKGISRSINLNPTVGYFIKDGLEVGTGLGLRHQTSISKTEGAKHTNRTKTISLNPYVRKYIPLFEQLQLHGTAYASFGIGNQTAKNNQGASSEVVSTHNSLGIGVYPGLTYFATPRLGFTAVFGNISYDRSREKSKENQPYDWSRGSNSFNANFSPSSIGVGFSYFISR
ncbi:outer membrane beta-barrel protein [Pontibacter virosus]|uniref:Outer membrane protein with beta-barrel domain n=1 Tax=Pontibacter virosus TaxID=1765052 RepID=A0A2U1ASP7_9BACT|nr:outer membrane beta-barrel protein [Pontibacter virosus]PVY39428.1 outer membrane protein with beta-barrel domain [Pontibacter virosus]